MDYFQSIVEQYLQADRANLISTEFFLQHKDKENDLGPPNWYIDILNVNMREQRVYLCEITYARKLHDLIKKLRAWTENSQKISQALQRAHIPQEWPVRVWLFVPESSIQKLLPQLPNFDSPPRITPLEMTLPWKYDRWNRIVEAEKPAIIPEDMRV